MNPFPRGRKSPTDRRAKNGSRTPILESIGDRRVKKSLNKEIDALVTLTSALLEQKRLTTQQDVLKKEEVALHAWIAETCEPFLLVDRSRSGTRSAGGFGLGLSIVRAVAEAHGAEFAARNLAPRGFSVTLSFGRIRRV